MKIFIGYDSRFPEPAHVLDFSIRCRTDYPVDIEFLKLSELDFDYKVDEGCSTEFTHSRFLIPHLCNYEGIALFLDNDILCLDDIGELLCHNMSGTAIRCVHHKYVSPDKYKMYGTKQVNYTRKNWASVMLLDCSKLKQWTKEYVENTPGIDMLQFSNVPNEQIGGLHPNWNVLDIPTKQTRLLHYTSGGPWFDDYLTCPGAGLWIAERGAMHGLHDAGLGSASLRLPRTPKSC